MSKGEYITDGIVPLRGVVRDGVLASILDHNGNELGAPVTTEKNEVTKGRVELSSGVETIKLSPIQRDALVTVIVGNSIANQNKFSGVYWSTNGEITIANQLCESAMRFKRITASTRADSFGVYGYGGQTLPTINADLEAQIYTPLYTAGVVPDLVVAPGLLENDISGGATYAAMVLSLTQFIRDVQARYPGVILLLATPHPSFSNNTPAIVSAYQQITSHMLSLDDGYSIYVASMDGYENPALPGTPLSGYTDASVHPNAKGASVNARAFAAAVMRMGYSFKRPFRRLSNNMSLSGTGAASGTNVSGTTPTSFTTAGSANGTFVITAEQPGALIAITANVKGSEPPSDLATSNAGAIALSAVTEISPVIEIEIVSGAENISSIELAPRILDGGGNNFQYHVQRQTNDYDIVYENGDILTILRPPAIAASATISQLTNYLRVWPKLAGGAFSVRVLSQGCEIVS